MTHSEEDGPAIATSLDGVTIRGERNMLAATAVPGIKGARAALETFYYAFNTRSVDLLKQIWADDPLTQLVSPFGFLRGSANNAAAYGQMPTAPVQMQTVLEDIVAYTTPTLAVFTMRENGTASQHNGMTELTGRTSCVFSFIASQSGSRLIYHQVSINDPDSLTRLQMPAH
jgi:SnoaL-like domain